MNIQQWHDHILQPLLTGQQLTANVEESGGLALLVADTDRTQGYVFESDKLPEIRGASRQLDDENEHVADMVRERFHPDCVIYAGGGSLLALIPHIPQDLDDLRDAIEAEYPSRTGAATITADWRPVTAEMVIDGYPNGGFGGLVRWAGGWLRRRKESKQPGPFYEALPHTARCRSCHIRPADAYASFPDWPLCHVCASKRKYEGRNAWFRRFQTFLTKDENTKLTEQYYGHDEPFPPFNVFDNESPPRQIPQDLSELGQAGQGKKGYVGLIYLDGDRLGDMLHRLGTAEEYRNFSAQIRQTTEHVVMAALASHLHPEPVWPSEARAQIGEAVPPGERIRIHPFEIITIGGDDVWLIVPGAAALPVAAAIVTGFQAASLRRPGSDKLCTLSGGVVIADDHNPVRVLRDLAKSLTKEAKRARQDAGDAEIGYIDFHILKSADMLDRTLARLRSRYPYTLPAGAKDLKLSSRPYPADVLARLWEKLGVLRAHTPPFPPSQMHLLAESLLEGRHESSLFYQYQRVRDNEDHFQRLDEALEIVQGSQVVDPIPWVKLAHDRYSHQTALWDIAELYGFVPGTKE
jgi:CRISPR-associated protein Cmr2